MSSVAILSSDFSYKQFQTKINLASHSPHRSYCISIRLTYKCKSLIKMILMIANNNSSYLGYNEVNRVEESGDESEKNAEIGKCNSGCAYT